MFRLAACVAITCFGSVSHYVSAFQRSNGDSVQPHRIQPNPSVVTADDLSSSCLANEIKVSKTPTLFTDDDVKRVLTAETVTGHHANMRRIFDKMRRGEEVQLMSFGGSFTKGEGCNDEEAGVRGRDCSWVARTLRWWSAAFPEAKLTWFDHARSSTTAAGHLSKLGALTAVLPKAPDLILIDTLQNDAVEPTRWLRHELGITLKEAKEVSMEAFVQTLQELMPETQILMVEDGCPGYCIDNVHYHTQVAERYGIPVVNYAAMVRDHNKLGNEHGPDRLWPQEEPEMVLGNEWPNFAPRTLVDEVTCCPGLHPPWIVHHHIAGAVSSAITSLLEDTCKEAALEGARRDEHMLMMKKSVVETTCQDSINKFLVCKQPIVLHSAESALKKNEADHGSITYDGWKLSSMNSSWSASTRGSTIRFPVRVGQYPSVGIQWKGTPRASVRLLNSADESQATHGIHQLSDRDHAPKLFGATSDEADTSAHFTFYDVSNDGQFFGQLADVMKCEREGCPSDYTLEITMEEDVPLSVSAIASC